jgi:rare lipoprotein A
MTAIIRKGAFFIMMTAFFVSCAPNRAMTRNSDGMTGHDGGVAKEDTASADKTYSADDDFAVEDVDLETAEPKKPVAVKSINAKPKAQVKAEPKTADAKDAPVYSDDSEIAIAPAAGEFQQKGNASWYGREFQGKKTASGEKFNMNDLTAAHKTLPLGSVVLVKNLENGKTVKVRINDRGPFAKNRIIDLSHAAAKKLDMISSGEAPVAIKVLSTGGDADFASSSDDVMDDAEAFEPEKPANKKNAKTKGVSYTEPSDSEIALQTGAFYTKKNAEKMKSRLEEIFPGKEVLITHDGSMYKVKVAGLVSRKDAEKCKKMLSAEEIDSFISGQE